MRRDPLALAALAAGALGFALLVLVDVWFVRVLAVLLLFTFIAAGVFAIATPALLDDDDEDA
jgi:hypothetical protein